MADFILLDQRNTQVNIRLRDVDGRSIQRIFLRHTREIGKKNGRNGYLIVFTHFITGETGQVDRGLCQSEVLQLAGIQCQLDRSFFTFQQYFRFRFHLQIRRQVHQYRFVRTVGKIGNAERHGRLLSAIDIGEGELVTVNADIADGVRKKF